MRESKLESNCIKLAKAFGWIAYKGSSRAGGADQLFIRRGKIFAVEFKVGKNKQHAKQVNEELIFEENGTGYYVVRSVKEFYKVMYKEV